MTELGGDVDSRDLAVDGEVAYALEAGVLLANRRGDQLAELVEACGVEAESRRSRMPAVAEQGSGGAVERLDDVDATGRACRALRLERIEARDKGRPRIPLGDPAGDQSDDAHRPLGVAEHDGRRIVVDGRDLFLGLGERDPDRLLSQAI